VRLRSVIVSNVLSEEKKQQVIALGRLGWSLRRIQGATRIRRETAASYLKAAGIAIRPPGAWGRGEPKPAIEVTTDFGAESTGRTTPEPQPGRSPASSASEPYREAIELGMSRGRNAMAIWQDLVDGHGFTAGYQSVKRFIHKLRGSPTPEARVVIETAPGEDYGEPRVMVRGGGDLGVLAHNRRRDPAAALHKTRYRASSHLMRLGDSWGVGAGVAWGPFVEPSALRFMSRSAWT
jgi:hypothetical protein